MELGGPLHLQLSKKSLIYSAYIHFSILTTDKLTDFVYSHF